MAWAWLHLFAWAGLSQVVWCGNNVMLQHTVCYEVPQQRVCSGASRTLAFTRSIVSSRPWAQGRTYKKKQSANRSTMPLSNFGSGSFQKSSPRENTVKQWSQEKTQAKQKIEISKRPRTAVPKQKQVKCEHLEWETSPVWDTWKPWMDFTVAARNLDWTPRQLSVWMFCPHTLLTCVMMAKLSRCLLYFIWLHPP